MVQEARQVSDLIPAHTTPAELAERLGASPRFVSDTVRGLGAFCKIGQKVIMLDHHVVAFMEAMECRSRSSSATTHGTTQERLPEGDFEALRALRTKGLRKGSQQKSRQKRGKVISMAQAQR